MATILKNQIENSESESENQLSDSDSSDYDDLNKMKKYKKFDTKMHVSSNRLPTRRPDPNVYNRNALMARENRRKKKEYVEMLENNYTKQCKITKKLQKILKEQNRLIHKLKNEKNYFKSILANDSQIHSLVNLIKNAKFSNSTNVSKNNNEFECSNYSFSSGSSPSQFDITPPSMIINDVCGIESDNDYNLAPLNYSDNLDNLLQETNINDFDIFGTKDNLIEKTNDIKTAINDEHSYYNTESEKNFKNLEEEKSTDLGVCLHISGGKLSLEFCAECHENSKKTIIDGF